MNKKQAIRKSFVPYMSKSALTKPMTNSMVTVNDTATDLEILIEAILDLNPDYPINLIELLQIYSSRLRGVYNDLVHLAGYDPCEKYNHYFIK